ncbi:MAG TPA: ammonium transporter [Thermoanaerobaculia bacterium]|nr:ammonium transporter [Thermoanaerobaculia bacterium]
MRRKALFGLLICSALATPALAQGIEPETKVALDTLWVLVAAMLVFFMNAGFAMLETGLCRAKNAVNILAKNFIVFGLSSIAFWAVGFALMFGDGNALFGSSGWFLLGGDNSPAMDDAYQGVFSSLGWTGVPLEAKFFFQLAFAATAATIVSGAVAERVKFSAFILFSAVLVATVYAVGGHWAWGGGWLSAIGFADFAGSTVVHSVGGWAALAGAILLGPRRGKYLPDGGVRPIPGHNMGLATLGALILWLGWFGFNPGSTMAADPAAIASIALNTNMAAAAGALAATVTAWVQLGKPDLTMILNGGLAGLVAITAGCNAVSVSSSVLIGTIGGVLVVYSVLFFDKVRIDDPVGALSVHLVNGMWGTLAVGLFAIEGGLFFGGGIAQTVTQAIGIAAIGAFVFAASTVIWLLLKVAMGIRVSPQEELEGLDVGEHGIEAYPGFVPAAQEMSAEII